MNNQITDSQYVQGSIFIAVFDLQSLVMDTSVLTPDQKEAIYNALEDIVEAVK
jgi:hypothetical protein|nr:MAG TPA: hypothetical protein [Caudoviricetes sp.]